MWLVASAMACRKRGKEAFAVNQEVEEASCRRVAVLRSEPVLPFDEVHASGMKWFGSPRETWSTQPRERMNVCASISPSEPYSTPGS